MERFAEAQNRRGAQRNKGLVVQAFLPVFFFVEKDEKAEG
jgi:hypothetical protein